MSTAKPESPDGGRLKVLYLVNDLRLGGAERQLVELAKGLDKDRFQALVVTLYPGQSLEEELRQEPGVELRSLNRRSRYDFAVLPRLANLLRQQGVQIVQPFLTPAAFFGLAAAIMAGTPLKVVTERCGLRLSPHFGNRLYRFAEDRLTRFADAAIPNSEAGRGYLLTRGVPAAMIRVIHNGVNPQRLVFRPEEVARVRADLGVPRQGTVVGIVASLSAAKDHATFLRAASQVATAAPDTVFAVVGDGPLRAELQRMAQGLGLGSRATFLGNQARVAPYIAAFDVAVLSSCDHEGCSNFLLEAMGLGRPVVATSVGGNSELVTAGKTGLLVPPADPQALAEAIIRLLHNAPLARRLAEAGQQRFWSDFSLSKMVGSYEELYRALWERKQAGSLPAYLRSSPTSRPGVREP